MSEVETLTNQASGGGFNPQTAGVQQPAALAKTNVSKKGPLGFFGKIFGPLFKGNLGMWMKRILIGIVLFFALKMTVFK